MNKKLNTTFIDGIGKDAEIEHALCRIHMAIATKETEGFSYTEPFKSV